MIFKSNDQELRRQMLEDAMRIKALIMRGDPGGDSGVKRGKSYPSGDLELTHWTYNKIKNKEK